MTRSAGSCGRCTAGYPVGGLLTWETQADGSIVRGAAATTPALRVLILDGQQRVTTLYGISRGRPPAFFQGDEKAFSGLRFNVEDETFEFYGPAKMRDDPRWIDVTSLFMRGLEHHIGTLNAHPDTQPRIVAYMERLARLGGCWTVTSMKRRSPARTRPSMWSWTSSTGSTPAAPSYPRATWPWPKCARTGLDARAGMRSHLESWQKEGFAFSLDWLLRNTTAVATGRR